MEPNKFYCRNATSHSTAVHSSMPSTSPSTMGLSEEGTQSHVGCMSGESVVSAGCRDSVMKNAKSQSNHRGTNTTSGINAGSSTSGYGSSTSSNGTGNYVNVMPMPMGTLQYHRRKLTPQDYQSRLYYNTTDYRCRDDYYSLDSSGRLETSSPSPSLQFQHQQHQIQQQPQQLHHHHHQHIHNHSHQHQACAPTNTNNNGGTADCVDEVLNGNIVTGNSRVVAATQTQHAGSGGGHCEQVFPATTSVGVSAVSPAPLLYTVHRVVTTAQIQTSGGNAFASSSSVSSVVSAARNEADNLAAASSASTAGNSGCMSNTAGISGSLLGATGTGINANSAFSSTIAASGAGIVGGVRSSPGVCTNISYPQQCNNTSEVQQSAPTRISSNNFNNNPTTSSSTSNYSSGAKTSIPRALQNVIPTCVYLMSRIAVHMEIEGTAQCPSQVMLAAALGCEELGIANKLLAQSIFGLWMTSSLLEIQLKSHHRPYVVRVAWHNLLDKFSHGNPIVKKFDEPMIMLKRNVYFSKRDEEKIKDHRILELLYEEAKHNVLSGRYIMESVHSVMLGGIQARIELGPYNSHIHTTSFFRENQSRFLPQHVAKNSSWSWMPVSRKNSAEVKLLEQYKRVPQTATTRKLMRKYLEFCWALPFYGAAFFHGQVEQPVRGLMSLVNHKDVSVIIAINERGIFIIDPVECTLLLGLRYEDLSWDFAKPSTTDDTECQTCIFLQFDAVENGIQISKLMQIFSKQAAMMDALIAHFAELMRKRKDGLDGSVSEQFHDEPNPIQNNGNGVLCNKLSRLTLATYDEDSRCIGQMGSLSISY